MRNPPLPTGFPKASPVIHAEARITGLTSGRTADRGGKDSYAWRTGVRLIGCTFTQNFMGYPHDRGVLRRRGISFSPEFSRLFTKSAECAILTITNLITGAFIVIKPIIRDVFFLSQKSAPAVPDDLSVAADLRDTLTANAERCVGMAANMIGVAKRIIIFDDDGEQVVMFNPELVKASTLYETEEGCLSLDGVRKTKRYKTIKVKFQNEAFQTRIKTYTGWTAQIIQHELDHLDGIII